MKALKWIGIVLVAFALFLGAAALFFSLIVNPEMIKEIRTNPTGEEAGEAMIRLMWQTYSPA